MAKVTMTPALGAAGGSMSNLSFVRQPDGTTSMRERKGGAQPRTPAKMARETAMTRVSRAWQELEDGERDAWEAWSLLLHELGPTPSLSRPRAGYRVFSSLGLKALQATPGMAVPRLPPTAPFGGDGARVHCGLAIVDCGERAARDTTIDNPKSTVDTSGVRFTCLVPNSPGVATELLVQSLASPGRKGEAAKYRSRGFVAFSEVGETATVALPAGTCLVAVRFVELASGQAGGLVPLGRLRVG